MDRRSERTIRINRGLPEILAKDGKALKAMAVFYSLKFLYVGGTIRNMTGRYDEIARRIGISPTNLRNKLRYLLDKGLVQKEGRNIHFRSFNHITKKFKIKTNKSFRVSYTKVKPLETVIKALALESNFEKQRFRIKKGIVNEEIRRYGKIEARTIRNKIKKYIRTNIGHYAEKYKKRVSSSPLNPFTFPKVNTEVSVSRKRLAEINGRISKSTGTRLIRKMSSLGLLESDSKRIERISSKTPKEALRHLDLDSSFFVYKNVLYRRKSNLVLLNKFFA